jgi:hypothetical protein
VSTSSATEPAPDFDRWMHGLKNQLSIVLGFTEILLQEFSRDDPKWPDLQEIHRAAVRAMDAMSRAPRPKEGSGG